MSGAGRVGTVARLLGYAGLLPSLVSTGVLAIMRVSPDSGLPMLAGPAAGLAMIYPLVILSFLGGMWWSFAMRRNTGQGRLAALAVLPSLAAVALLGAIGITGLIGWGLVAVGIAVMLTLLVDCHLVSTDDAPVGWMSLRVPLSVGLGGLTILSGALIGTPTPVY